MKLQVLAIGRARKDAAGELGDMYARRISRIGPGLGFRQFAVRDYAEAAQPRPAARMASEAKILLDTARGATLVALDERGKDMTSADFATLLATWRDEGVDRTAFVIGGADGLDGSVLDAADRRLRFGRQTWPHLLVRAMLAEQIYRAMTILAGHPYHRE